MFRYSGFYPRRNKNKNNSFLTRCSKSVCHVTQLHLAHILYYYLRHFPTNLQLCPALTVSRSQSGFFFISRVVCHVLPDYSCTVWCFLDRYSTY